PGPGQALLLPGRAVFLLRRPGPAGPDRAVPLPAPAGPVIPLRETAPGLRTPGRTAVGRGGKRPSRVQSTARAGPPDVAPAVPVPFPAGFAGRRRGDAPALPAAGLPRGG